jgi:hypothetical protein
MSTSPATISHCSAKHSSQVPHSSNKMHAIKRIRREGADVAPSSQQNAIFISGLLIWFVSKLIIRILIL